jgi:signal transduction histidine kinase/ActR/RegA family two-component response regulator
MLSLLEPLGNFTVLQQPVYAAELVSTVHAALRVRRRQYQLRDWIDRWERALRHRDRFLSLLAHELRNPLTAIQNAVEILEHVGPQTQALAEHRALLARQTTRLALSIEEMLEIYQVLAGKLRLRRQPTDLGPLTARGVAFVEAQIQGRRQELALDPASGPVLVNGDPQRLQEMINHLLMEAVQLAPPAGRIDVAVNAVHGEAVLRVALSESSVPPEACARLLSQFSENDDTLERPPEGGLAVGLTLVQGLAKLQGGSTSVAPVGPDDAVEFVVRFPLAGPGAVAPAPQPGAILAPGPRRLLVIEDDRDTRDTLRMVLQLWGHQVETAADGSEGIRKALADRPEIVLSDIGLPGEDGYAVARQIRAALGRDTYLVAMTGFGQPHDRQKALEAGFDTHLVKPVMPAALQELLSGVLGGGESRNASGTAVWAPGSE